MPKFYVCEHHGYGKDKTPCVFTESSMRPLWKRSNGDVARCIRHGALITVETTQPDIESARQWAKSE